MAQRIPLPLTVSCFSKIQIGFNFLVPARPGGQGQRAIKWVCVIEWPRDAQWPKHDDHWGMGRLGPRPSRCQAVAGTAGHRDWLRERAGSSCTSWGCWMTQLPVSILCGPQHGGGSGLLVTGAIIRTIRATKVLGQWAAPLPSLRYDKIAVAAPLAVFERPT